MAAQTATSLGVLYGELNKYCQNSDYDRAVKSANKVLHHHPDEVKAFHCKIVSLIQLDKFQDALQAINKSPKLAVDLILEKAYCQYRLNQIEEALKTVNSAPSLSFQLKELKAQILYRLESYDECFDVYRDIIRNTNDDYEEERETNFSAVIANMLLDGSEREEKKKKEEKDKHKDYEAGIF